VSDFDLDLKKKLFCFDLLSTSIMFEAKFPQAALLKKVLDALTGLIDDATFDCNDEGLGLQAMDSSHVSLVAVKIPSETFENFRCDRNLSLGLNLGVVTKIIKTANNEDVLTLKANSPNDTVCFLIESRNGNKVSEYNIRQLDLDTEHLDIPQTDYDCVIRLPSVEFQRICRDLSQVGESVVIDCDKEGVAFAASGDLGTGNVKLAQTAAADRREESVVIEMREKTTLTFALRYLNLFTKATPLSAQVKLSMSEDVPLVVEYSIGESGFIRYYLAPKIEED